MIDENKPPYLFSIVMAIYNVEKYLEDAIESVVNQSIGFEENVQLILVDDGSPDNSELICKTYQEKYPNNVIYIKQKNAGVSVARNTGIELAEGKYINFLDSDDYFDLDVLEKVNNFFELNGDEIDLVAIPLIFFEAKQGPHMLHYKFKSTRIIDIDIEYDSIQLQSGSTFIKRENGLGELRFLPGQKFGEDASLLTDIIMKKRKFGVIHDSVYNYRARTSGTSALQGSKESFDYYIPTIDMYYIPKLEKYNQLYQNRVPKYIQFLVMYDMQFRLKAKVAPEVLKGHMDDYYNRILYMLKFIDIDIIWKQRYLNWYQKHALSNMKIRNEIFKQGDPFYESSKVLKTSMNKTGEEQESYDIVVSSLNGDIKDCLSNRDEVTLHLCEFEDDQLIIVGRLGSLLPQENMKVYMKSINGHIFESKKYDFPGDTSYIVGEPIYEFFGFQLNIPIDELKVSKKWMIYIEVDGVSKRVGAKFSASAKLSNKLKNGYMVGNNEIMVWFNHDAKRFDVKEYSIVNMLKKERKIRLELKKNRVKNFNKISRTRVIVRLLKRYKKKKINLFMDRIDKADDSAEYLLEYFEQHKNKTQKNYYVIKNSSKDFKRLQDKFPVINYKGARHKLNFLLADKLISTHADRFIYQPFTGTENYFKDLKEYKYIFLQHGVIMGDLSNWLKKHDKNFKLFLTSSKIEQESIVKGHYGYTNREVKLTGLPRYDNLRSDKQEKLILIMPTWRRSLVNEFSNKLNARPYNETFKESNYFYKWNALLNDESLKNYCLQNGYKILFAPHPSIRQQLSDFNLEDVEVTSYDQSYSELFQRGSILVTDNSSVFFDFAYMKKPLFYYQFEPQNWDPGYFSIEEMGFGKIIVNHQVMVQTLIKQLETGIEMDEEYKQRVDQFFEYTDQNNRKRAYEEIIKL
ncbi:CDP-glycerol glycerophosphotransferase family protein [Shouchella miscanthi]|uniref:CDP-glycerol glycerophosphotransferase family protein n=1 Tax=Shouchella miscanthi TaxID=2598861 RepID=A0ABU6NPV6_9BACI|nr:CDP-glycerol glycerophosphotransferase family protein [Shouchella miscanthi]MED4130206.1 CDP-glycerol glycerophosphotransferase family protein [Shouchella miscanthi]